MYERFTDRARKVMQLANQEAQFLDHEYIGTEHILLGLVKEGEGVGANALKNLGIDLQRVRQEIDKILMASPVDTDCPRKLPLTPRAKKVIEYAREEAKSLRHDYVDTEHLLLGLMRETEGLAAQIIMNLGTTLPEVRNEVVSLLGGNIVVGSGQRDQAQVAPAKESGKQFENLPPELMFTLEEIDSRLQKLKRDKEEAVAEQDFDRARLVREKEEEIERKVRFITENFRVMLRGSLEERRDFP
jgi:ATP-dependent Clp protease ATP-binding subunit ClpC